jgi:hypothetical protein
MKTIRKEEYAIPVYSFGSDAQVGEEPARPDEGQDRIIVRRQELQIGTTITAIVDTDSSYDYYTFRETDSNLHAFGFGVENIEILGDWFNTWVEAAFISKAIDEIGEKHAGVPLFRELTEDSQITRLLTLALIARWALTIDEYTELWAEFAAEYPVRKKEVFPTQEASDLLVDIAQEQSFTSVHKPSDIEITVEVETTTELLEAEGQYLAVNIITPFGAERVLFQVTNSERCVYQRKGQASRANPVAVAAACEEGYEVTNAKTVVGVEDDLEILERAISFCDELQSTDRLVNQEIAKTALDGLFGIVDSRLVTLSYLVIVYEIAGEEFRNRHEQFRRKVGRKASHCEAFDEITEILTTIVGMLSYAHRMQILNHLQDSSVFEEYVQHLESKRMERVLQHY